MPTIDILGLGCVAVDDLLFVPGFPVPETKTRVRHRERQCGGLTANALVAAARLGARCAYAGPLGVDEGSAFVRATLEREGIDLTYVLIRPDVVPIHSTIIVDERAKTRTVLFDLRGSLGALADWPPDDLIRSASVLYVDHYGIEGMTRAAEIARRAGVPVVADLERNEWPGFPGLLRLVDHLIVTRTFAHKLTGESHPARSVEKLWHQDRAVCVVTSGADGCFYQTADGVTRHVPAFRTEVVDSTGCGDVFHGAYAAALARGVPLEERLRQASAAAALKARHPGAQAGAPTRAAVEAFLAAADAGRGGER